MKTTFEALPDDARLWVFTTDRALSPEEAESVCERLLAFADSWTSHSRPVEGAVEVREGRFVMVAAQIRGGDVSGCGTDKLFHAVEEALGAVGAALAPSLSVAYRDDAGAVQVAARSLFRTLAPQGRVTPDTGVFDVSLTELGALRAGRFEQPAASTWLARYFAPARA